MGAMASQITSLMIVYSTLYSGAHQRIPHKGPVTRKMFPFDVVIMSYPQCVVQFSRNVVVERGIKS